MALSGNAPRRFARNAALNLLGHLAPLVAALIAIPYLAAALGTERFGLLALAWVLVGYFSLFDLGLGRALTRALAERGLAAGDASKITGSALAAMLVLGAAAAAVLASLAPWLCARVLGLAEPLQGEAVAALRVLAACLPFVTATAGLRGILEADQRFGWVNAIRVPLGFLTFLAPMAAAAASRHMAWLALALAAVRIAGALAHWIVCDRLFPGLLALSAARLVRIKSLLAYGSWLTVSTIVGPLMVYLDRFIIGVAIALPAVAYYSAPYEIVTRLWLIPAALTGVLFPAFAGRLSGGRVLPLYRWGIKAVFLATYPLTLCLALLAPEWLQAWLGEEYARNSAAVARLLAIGVMINCMAYLPFTLLQAAGRADVVAKLHLAELPLYLAALAALVAVHGIEGAALAWIGRCAVDAAALFALAARLAPMEEPVFAAGQGIGSAALAVLLVAGTLLDPGSVRLAYTLAALAAFSLFSWFVLLSAEERRLARHPSQWLAEVAQRK